MPTTLTERETQILTLAGRHVWSSDQIATVMGISPSTVNNTLRSAYLKVGVSDRRRAYQRAAELGILRLGVELPIADAGAVPPPAVATDEIADTGAHRYPRRSLYQAYANLGRYRTPKLWGGSRTAVILLGAVAVVIVLAMVGSVITMIDGLSPYR